MKKAVFAILAAAVPLLGGCEKVMERNKEADDLAETVLRMFSDGQAEKIYDELGASGRRTDEQRKQWLDLGKQVQGLGKPKGFKRTSFKQNTTNGVTTGEFEYQVTWEKVAGKFVLKTKLENNKWKVLRILYDTTK